MYTLIFTYMTLTDLNPLASKEYDEDGDFRKFRRQLFHTAIARMLLALKPGMTTPVVMQCPDGHYRRAIFSLGPYIADYPEQCMLALVVQRWCAKYVLNLGLDNALY